MSKDHRVKFDDDALKATEAKDVSSLDELHCPLPPFNLRLAATYVEDARLGHQSAFEPTESKLRLYGQYGHPVARWLLCAVLVCHLCLAVVEEPAMPGCSLPYWVCLSLEAAFISFYAWRIFLIANFAPQHAFKSDPKLIILCVTIVVIVIDMLVYIGLHINGIYCIRFSRAMRPVLCVCWPELRSVRVALRTLRRALPAVVHVALLYCAVLVTASLMAYKMLGRRGLVLVSGRSYFSSYLDSLFDMYVLVTTANHPDIMMPAFNEHVVYVTFFVAFLVLCYFIYMNVVLAVIYNSYKRQLKAEVLESFLSRQEQLQRAFDLLCHKGSSGPSVVCSGRFQQLVLALPQRRSPALTAVLFAVLDSDNSGAIDRVEFRRLADLLSVEVSEIQAQSRCLQAVSSTLPRCSRALTTVVNSRWFQYFFDGLTVVNAIVISISEENSWWDAPLEWCFLSCFVLEIVLKLATLGVWRFFKRAWNTFDFIVIGLAFAMGVVEAALDEERESRLSLDVLLVLRVLRLVKIVGSIKSFQMIVHTLAKIVPSLKTYGAVILIFYYTFAIAGMEIFAGLIEASSSSISTVAELNHNNTHGFPLYCGNPALKDTDFWRQRYCNNNFNDVLHAFIVLFELTVVNQWHVLAYGFAAVTHSAARLFFLVFHLLCVTLLLNVFTAFVLEVFLLEYSASEGVMETQLESKIMALGLSESRRRRKFSTISHDELVMQDSDEEDDDYYLGKKSATNLKKRSLQDSSEENPSSQYRESDIGLIFKKRESSFALDENAYFDGIASDTKKKSNSLQSKPDKSEEVSNLLVDKHKGESVLNHASLILTESLLDTLSEPEDLPNINATDPSESISAEDTESNVNDSSCNDASETSVVTHGENLSVLDSSESVTTTSKAAAESVTNVTSPEAGAKSHAGSSTSDTNMAEDQTDECCCRADPGRTLASLLADTSVRFHLSKSVRSVEVLLQRMFQEELQQEYQRVELRKMSTAHQSDS